MEGLVKKTLHTDSAEQTGAVFGVLDKNIKELENAFGVTVRSEDSEETAGNTLIVEGNGEESVGRAAVEMCIRDRYDTPSDMIFSNDTLFGITPSLRNDNDFLFVMIMTVIFGAVSIGRRQIETASK